MSEVKVDVADAVEPEKPLAGPCVSYANGEARPRLRGAVHFGASVVSAAAVLALLAPAASDCTVWPLLGFLCGKLACYSASAFYHTSRATAYCEKQQRAALAVDMVCVSVSVLSTGIPFADAGFELYYGASMTFFLLVVLAVSAGTRALKDVAVFCQIVFTLSFTGAATGGSGMWALSSTLVLLSLLCYLPVMLRTGHGAARKEPVVSCAPWHERGVYGAWEDFHAANVAADVFYFVTAAVYVQDLSCGDVGAVGA